MITKYVFQIRLQMYTCVMFNVGDFFLFRLSTLSLKQKKIWAKYTLSFLSALEWQLLEMMPISYSLFRFLDCGCVWSKGDQSDILCFQLPCKGWLAITAKASVTLGFHEKPMECGCQCENVFALWMWNGQNFHYIWMKRSIAFDWPCCLVI